MQNIVRRANAIRALDSSALSGVSAEPADGGHWSFAFEITGQGVWDCDVKADCVHYSRMWKQIRGYQPEEVVDSAFSAWMERVHPDDRAQVMVEMRRQNSPAVKVNVFEYRERHRDGHYIWIQSLGAAIAWAPDGTPTRVIGTDTDITGRKQAEMERLQLSRRVELAIESSRDGVTIVDIETLRVVQTNSAFAGMLQREVKDVVGRHPWEWDAQRGSEEVSRLLLQESGPTPSREPLLLQALLKRQDGGHVEVEVSYSFFEAGGRRFAYGTIRDITERKRVDRALQAETKLRRIAVEASHHGIVLVALGNGMIVQANRAFAAMLGVEASDVVGTTLWSWEAVPGECILQVVLAEIGVSATGSASRYDSNVVRADGSLVQVQVEASVIEVEDSRYCQVVMTDVTASKASEMALRQSEAKFRAMFENTRRFITLLEPDGRIIDANPVSYDFAGLRPHEVGELYFWDGDWWQAEGDRASIREAVERAAAGEYVTFQIDISGADGAVLTVDQGIGPIRDAAGRVVQLMAEATDITALKNAKAELAQSQMRWNHALESAGQGVWEWSLENPQTRGSRVWKQMRGYAPEEEIDFSYDAWLERVHPDDRARIRTAIERQQDNRQEYNSFEYRERHKAGHYVWINSVGAAVEWDEQGTPIRRIGTDSDITERKLAEQRVLDLSRRLELALDASRFGVFEVTLDNDAVLWDDRLCEIAGFSREQAPENVGALVRVIHPDDLLKAQQVRDQARAETSFELEFRLNRPDGVLRTMRSRGATFKDEHGVLRLIGLAWDVTEEAALTQSLHAAKHLAETRNVELERAKARLEYQSLHDALTGLPNRRYLDKLLERHAQQSLPGSASLALLHIDLDGFKQINDTLGHSAGDAMLVHVAGLLRANIGLEQFAARVGGDEFVIACPSETRAERLQALANRIIEVIRKPVPYQGHVCRLGASIGIAVETGAAFNAQRVLINADIALYQAKGRGRNRHEFFSADLQEEIASEKRIADDILRGIEQGEFVPHYQPLVDAKTFQLVGLEALARWNHPADGLLGPACFLKAAERLDMLGTIDHMILDRSIKDLEAWHAFGINVPSVSVNVTFQRLNDEKLLPRLRGLRIKPGTISFEFLESIFLDEIDDKVAATIDALRQMGIAIDVDDFGTGHTSIVSLLKLSPRRLKIDRQLVGPIVDSPEQRRLIAAIVDIGASLGIGVVAEGVETMGQASILRDLGCDALQGFAFARPMPAGQIAAWIKTAGGGLAP
ncbi:PAS domain S-box protein [Devosia sp. FKR38]|uniref:PAS domain S-box protein n=1 Tax=Devosia sp. FKR38 TaxID=2562312 RepID=UPI0014850BAD|nr:PAS domain S-box protein [Devosia sp. FKR38]